MTRSTRLKKSLRPTLEDYGLTGRGDLSRRRAVSRSRRTQLVLPDEVVRAAERCFGEAVQPVVTYLANTIAAGEGDTQRKIPYSTITGVDSTPQLGPLLDEAGQPIVLADDEIVLNRWAADDLEVKVGDDDHGDVLRTGKHARETSRAIEPPPI